MSQPDRSNPASPPPTAAASLHPDDDLLGPKSHYGRHRDRPPRSPPRRPLKSEIDVAESMGLSDELL